MAPPSVPQGGCGPDIRDVARAAHVVGLCVLPPREDGSKAPWAPGGTWKEFQHRRPTEGELARWYRPRSGIGLVTGAISGNLELLEFDDVPVYYAYLKAAAATGLGDLVERIEAGYLEQSPSGGVHWLYYCSTIEGNTKLARRPKTPEEMKHPNDKVKTLVETKGEGGYVIVSPTNGRVHPNGKAYRLLAGSLQTIPTITPEERQTLWELARTFDQMPRREVTAAIPPTGTPTPNRTGQKATQGNRPGDIYNATVSWEEVLEPHGWRKVFTRDGTTHWRRPGKSLGTSATTNYMGSDLLKVFSSSTPFEPESGYTKFAAYAVLEHGGDYRAAARSLTSRGYGAFVPIVEWGYSTIGTNGDDELIEPDDWPDGPASLEDLSDDPGEWTVPCGFPAVFAMPSILISRKALHQRTALSLIFLAASALPLAALGVGLSFGGDAILGLLDSMKAKMTFAVVLYSSLGILAIAYALSQLGVIHLPSLTAKVKNPDMPGQDKPYRRSLVLGSTMGAGLGMGCPMPSYYILLGWVAAAASPLYGALLLGLYGLGRVLPAVVIGALITGGMDRRKVSKSMTSFREKTDGLTNGFLTAMGSYLIVLFGVVLLARVVAL